MARPPVAFLAWSHIPGRSVEIAESLGGESKCFFDLNFVSHRLIPLRYLISAVRTVLYLLTRRPRSVIVTNPPIFPGVIAYIYGRLTGSRIILDSHPSSFGFDPDNTVVSWGMPLHRFLIPRVTSTMVTEQRLVDQVVQLGGRADIVHEAQPRWTAPPAPPLGERPNVLLVNVFAKDEPVHIAVQAARLLPEVDFYVTGDLRKRPETLALESPQNVHYTGFLEQTAYLAAIKQANVVMSLSERPEDVSRSASEAVFACRPLIVSDWPSSRRYFPFAIAVTNTAEGIAEGVSEAVERYDSLREVAGEARDEQQKKWESQLAVLRELVGVA